MQGTPLLMRKFCWAVCLKSSGQDCLEPIVQSTVTKPLLGTASGSRADDTAAPFSSLDAGITKVAKQ